MRNEDFGGRLGMMCGCCQPAQQLVCREDLAPRARVCVRSQQVYFDRPGGLEPADRTVEELLAEENVMARLDLPAPRQRIDLSKEGYSAGC